RDRLLTADQNNKKEIERLEQKIKQMNIEFRNKSNLLEKQFQDTHKAKVDALEKELKFVSSECALLKNEVERAKRDKRNAELEVERIIKAASQDHVAPSHVITDLSNKVKIANAERDEADRMVRELTNNQKRLHLQ